MFVCTKTHGHKPSEYTRTQVQEHLQLVLRSLQDLDQRRVSQKVLVQSALDPQEVLPKNGLDNQKTNLNLDPRTQRHWEDNILQLKEQLRTLKSRDAGLLSQIQDLDRQILELRLDTDLLHDTSPRPCDSPESSAPDSRPSSGFYDVSDGASLSNSVFSLCSTLDIETTPISPVTPPPAAEAPPLLTDMSSLQALLRHSLSSSVPFSAPSSAPPSSTPSSAPSSSAPLFSSAPSSSAPSPSEPPFSYASSSSAPSLSSAPLSSAPSSSAPASSSSPSSSVPPSSSATPFSFGPFSSAPLSAPSSIPSFSPSCLLESSAPPSFSPPPPPPPPPLSHLDRYIMSLLHGRSLGSRPSQPRTTKLLLSTRSPKVAMIRPPVRPPTKSNEDWAAVLGPDAEREARESRNKSEKHLNFNREPSAWRERREMNILRRESKRHKSRRDKNNCTFKCGALKLESEEDLRLKQKTDLCSGDKMIHRRSNMDKSTGHRRTFKSNMSLIKNNKLFTLGSKNNIESGGREREEQKRSRPEESRGGTTLRQRELGRRRQRRSVAQVQEDRASLRSCSVKSWRWSLVKSRSLCQSQCGRAVTSQQLTCRRPIREEHCSEEETGSEGEHSGMGGVRRQHLVRIKASQNLKKRIQRLKSGTFTLMTTV